MSDHLATSESTTLRPYDPERDRLATRRIWREIGWITKDEEEGMTRYVEAGRALVAEVNGEAECLVCTGTGSMRYLNEDLPFDFNALADAEGNVHRGRIVTKALLNPWKIPALIQLGQRSSLAARNLADFLQAFLDRLPE